MYQDWDFNKIIGEGTIKQTDWQKLWLYFFDAKQLNGVTKKLRKENGKKLLNWLKFKETQTLKAC